MRIAFLQKKKKKKGVFIDFFRNIFWGRTLAWFGGGRGRRGRGGSDPSECQREVE